MCAADRLFPFSFLFWQQSKKERPLPLFCFFLDSRVLPHPLSFIRLPFPPHSAAADGDNPDSCKSQLPPSRRCPAAVKAVHCAADTALLQTAKKSQTSRPCAAHAGGCAKPAKKRYTALPVSRRSPAAAATPAARRKKRR